MKVLITRPEPDASAFAEAVAALGHEPVVAPLMAIHQRDTAIDLHGPVQAFLITSANGARALGQTAADRTIPVFAVGAASGAAAHAAGFAHTANADGDVAALARLVAGHCKVDDGRLVHVCGKHVAGDLAGALRRLGFTVETAPLYEARAADTLPAVVRRAMASGDLDAIALFSPRSAKLLCRLICEADLQATCPLLNLLCLSQAVADAAAILDWRSIRVAAAPTADALLTLMEQP